MNYKWYKAYYNDNIKGGTGINPLVYNKPNGNYFLTNDDKTVLAPVTPGATLPTHISKAATVSKIAGKYYSGSAVKPTVTVNGLTKGSDYTVSYADNNAPGTAKAIIKGKDKYTGSIEVNFSIKLKKLLRR